MKRIALGLLWVALLPAGGRAQVIQGRLLDASSGEPIMLGYVSLLKEDGERATWTLTNESGFFRVEAPDPGSFMLYGEALGYRSSVEGPLLLGKDQTQTVEFSLDPMPVVLDSILVEARSRRLSLILSGFYEREQKGLGTFIGPQKILDNFGARRVTDLLWGVPGLQLVPQSNLAGSGYVPIMRGSQGLQGRCVPDLYLDGLRQWEATEIDQLILPTDIEGIEVYRGPSETPARFTTAGSACGVILIWSRKGR